MQPQSPALSSDQRTRKLFINERPRNREFKFYDNRIRTAKYDWWNFLPKGLVQQFMRFANFYFLILAVLQCISIISPLAPFSAIAPLVLVLLVSLVREAIEDYKRHRNDDRVNEQKILVYNNEKFARCTWKELHVGDIVKVYCDDKKLTPELPADIFLITSSDEHGQGYVETANLDGERNLKPKNAIEFLHDKYSKESLRSLKGHIVCDMPNNKVHQFRGLLYLEENGVAAEQRNPLVLGGDNLLLRGTILRNTEWVVGIVVYTGHDTKIMMNQGEVRGKYTHVEKMMNKIIIYLFMIEVILCGLCAWQAADFLAESQPLISKEEKHWYLYDIQQPIEFMPTTYGVVSMFTFFILLSTFIPISLIVSLESVKLIQSLMMEQDVLMREKVKEEEAVVNNAVADAPLKDAATEAVPSAIDLASMRVLNTQIHEELGKIEYVFTDKTGTLTANIMEFRGCCVGKRIFSDTELKLIALEEDAQLQELLLSLVLCHDVVRSIEKGEGDNSQHNLFQGSSPDEVCLVDFAHSLGYSFAQRTVQHIGLLLRDSKVQYRMLQRIAFTSERKRMTVVVEKEGAENSDTVTLYTKGADSFILSKQVLAQDSYAKDSVESVRQGVDSFAKRGLRTLVIAKKEIPRAEFAKWQRKYQRACLNQPPIAGDGDNSDSSLDDVSSQQGFFRANQERVQLLETELESGLHVIGATAVEDQLQEGVPETLADLQRAGIKVWMLTGDKLETAENIGLLCRLIERETRILRVQTHERESTLQRLYEVREQIYGGGGDAPADGQNSEKQKWAVVIEGDALHYTLNSIKARKEFVYIAQACTTVICCRATPTQKAEVVKCIGSGRTTLAIGDGGNDVNMIQAASVGVGILGKEGNQAAQASDYHFSQFRFLWRLLFVHGRWNLYRTTYFVNYFFAKNIILTLSLFLFQLYCGFSAQSFYDDGYLLNFNSLVTFATPIYFGAFEQDLLVKPDDKLLAFHLPLLYAQYRQRDLISTRLFCKCLLGTALLALGIYFSTQTIYSNAILKASGAPNDLWAQSVCSYFSTAFCIWIIAYLDTGRWSWITIICYVPLSVIIFFPIFTIVWDQAFVSPVQYTLVDHISVAAFWLTICLNIGCFFAIYYLIAHWRRLFKPTLLHALQAREVAGGTEHIPLEMQRLLHTQVQYDPAEKAQSFGAPSTPLPQILVVAGQKSQDIVANNSNSGGGGGGDGEASCRACVEDNDSKQAALPERDIIVRIDLTSITKQISVDCNELSPEQANSVCEERDIVTRPRVISSNRQHLQHMLRPSAVNVQVIELQQLDQKDSRVQMAPQAGAEYYANNL